MLRAPRAAHEESPHAAGFRREHAVSVRYARETRVRVDQFVAATLTFVSVLGAGSVRAVLTALATGALATEATGVALAGADACRSACPDVALAAASPHARAAAGDSSSAAAAAATNVFMGTSFRFTKSVANVRAWWRVVNRAARGR
jgi:hypothetical protein